ncbi:MAG: ABC transporter ATP-binding protein [Oscillospiraceae bacterium]|nr:ABC transporter ATP-binding protein [Oscillospiraceae bacterium]
MDEKRVMIDVDHVTIRFNLSNQKVDNLKEYFIKFLKRELMFQEFLAVKDVSFQVRQGEAWGLIGTNGSGKSTMLKAISGILKPYRGSISVNGTVAPLIELGAGFDPEMSARENIYLNGCVLGHTEKFMDEHFDEIVDFAEVRDFLDSPLKNYSSGMRARLGFSIATMVKPDILIVDEILAVGDYKFRQKCEKRMKELLSGGTTLLYVSHSIDEVKRLCDHAIWIDKGVERMQGEAKEVCDAYMREMKK